MNLEDMTIEEAQILRVFFNLLRDVGFDWAFAVGDSPREWVVCLYKEDDKWREYIIQDGKRIDYPDHELSLYDLCLSHLEGIGGKDYSKIQYLVNAFKKEAPSPIRRIKK